MATQRRNHDSPYSTLDEDMDIELETKNPKITDRQDRRDRLGEEHPDTLRLKDGKPVADTKIRMVRSFFWQGESHRWPNDTTVIRFARYANLEFERTVAMVTKGQFDRYFHNESGYKNRPGKQGLKPDGHCQFPNKALELSRSFALDEKHLATLYGEFQKLNAWAASAGYDLQSFTTLAGDVVRAQAHLFPCRSALVDTFVKTQVAQLVKLKAATSAQQDQFYRKKLSHESAEDLLGDWLLEKENQSLRLAKLQRQWLAVFGDVYGPLVNTRYSLLWTRKRIEFLQADPDLDRQTIDDKLKTFQSEWHDSLEELREDLATAKLLAIEGMGDFLSDHGIGKATADEVAQHEKDCKALLLKIHFRTHPNYVDSKPFTDEQRAKLRAYFDEAQALNKLLRRYNGVSTLLDVVPISQLQGVLAKVQALWDTIGVDFDAVRIAIPGGNLDQQIQWLTAEISRVEAEMRLLRDEIKTNNEHEEVRKRVASLSSDVAKADTRAQLAADLQAQQAELAQLQQQLDAMLATEAA